MEQNQTPQQNQYPDQQPVGSYQNLNIPQQQKEKKSGLAIAALILGIVSLVGICCCGLNIITGPLAIIFGIIVLAKKQNGTGLAITGIVLAAISLIMVLGVVFAFKDILPYSETITQDYTRLITEADKVFPAYEEDGTLPDYLEKYKEPPYSDFMKKYDADIYDVMDALLAQYKNGQLTMPAGMSIDFSELDSDSEIEDIPDLDLDAEPAI
ncbi:MAG: DUF4190 domain-containing protein [Oscillospiraceae bacterium]|nr:DUF4190 domain-containing protein [Oscillospiraceae bacterium]